MLKLCRYGIPALLSVSLSPISYAQIEEVLVTAQKREESLQDVPISIVAISGETIAEGGFSDMQELAAFVPNLHMTDTFTGQEIIIRGVGTSAANEAFEQAVAQFHDGVYYGRDNLGQNAMFDLERVEVIRGPAPIFAGQSATAGAVSYYSKRPGDEAEGFMLASYGDDEELRLEGGWGGPVTDTLGIRVAGTYYELGDAGYQDVLGNEQGTKENSALRGILVWNPTDNLEATFKYEYQDVSQIGVPGEYTRCETRPEFSDGNPGLGPGIPAACALDVLINGIDITRLDGVYGAGGFQDAKVATIALNAALPPSTPCYGCDGGIAPLALNRFADGLTGSREMNEAQERQQQTDVSMLELNYQWGDYLLTSQTSYVEYDKEDWGDPDASSFAIFSEEKREYFEQTSQEFRIASPTDQTVSWIWGGYYQKHDLDTSINIFTAVGPPGSAISFGGTLLEESEWLSSYLATTWNVTNAVRINTGVRYQNVEKTGDLTPSTAFFTAAAGDTEYNVTTSRFVPPGVEIIPAGHSSSGERFIAGPDVTGEVKSVDWLPEVGIQWDVAESVMLYVKYAEALKAGGFVMSPAPGGRLPDPFTFANESADSIEAGIKATLLDNTLQFNIALYDTNFENLQVTNFLASSATFVTENAAGAHSTGIEFDGVWAPTGKFKLGFSGHIGEAEYDEYPGGRCNALETKQSGLGPRCSVDRAGVDLPSAQDWSLVIRPEYLTTYGNFLVRLSAWASISPSFSSGDNLDPARDVPAYQRIDLRGSITPSSGNWEVALYVQDLTDERPYYAGTTDFQSQSLDQTIFDAGGVSRDRGRRIGLQVRANF